MKNTGLIILTLLVSAACFGNTSPTVTNVTASPSTNGSGDVVISFWLTDADNDRCTITVQVSSDGGNNWTITPSASALSGDQYVYPGNRTITWASKVDLPGVFGSNYRVKVTADDGYIIPMTWVSINDPGFVGQMSKYETTNAQYAQYLNVAKASNAITVSGSYVVGTSGPYSGQNYYNLAGAGYTYDGATNGGAARINWTGSTFTVDAGFENHPVTYVSWYGSTAFASYYGWRLPTEWEWQAVADYNGTYTYGCGTTISNNIANYYGSSHPYGTSIVGSFGDPSGYGYGMCDMAGNVWEWTNSIYSVSYRVIRGGGWSRNVSYCTVSYRYNYYPYGMSSSYGFRVCR